MPSNRMGGINRPEDDGPAPAMKASEKIGRGIGKVISSTIVVAACFCLTVGAMVVARIAWIVSTVAMTRMGIL